jgi:putative colanic acid biosynthesis acetyltransferase WcaF
MMPLDARISRSREGGASFPFRHRMFRLLWSFTWALLGRWTPSPLHAWRRTLLKLFGARIHSSAKVYPSARIWFPPNLEMKANACLGPGVTCYCMDVITLEEYALVSQGAHLCAGTHDVDDPHFQLVTRPIRIGANAWIAAEAFVGPGVTVGEGAVLGARSVAMKELAAWTIYTGNPAEPVRGRTRW